MAKKARSILARFQKMKSDKMNYLPLYQLCSEYVMSRKQGFTTSITPGEVQTEQIFDDTAPNANSLLAASLIGALWPSGAKSFRISMPFGMEDDPDGGETEEVKDFYQWQTKRMAYYMDNPKSGFITALEEYMLDQGAFGISGIQAEDQLDDFDVPIAYRAVDAKGLYIAEGKNGFVDRIYLEKEYTVRQLVEEYGFNNVSAIRQKAFMEDDNDTVVKVLQAVEPRMEYDPYAFGNKEMPIASIHIDIGTQKILREGGFIELPVAVTRFWKAMGEVYGRCPAMQALPSILEANALGEAWSLAVEKTLDPSLLVLDDGTMGSAEVDTSPGGITVVSVSGRIGAGTVPIQPLFVVGDLQWTALRRTELGEIIGRHFFQDRLTGLGKDERMQNPEVAIVNDLRGQSLNTTYSRQLGELFVPIIEMTYNKLLRRGLLGVIPGSEEEAALLARGITPKYIPEQVAKRMMSGQEVYRIDFISPATRIMNNEELQGITHLINTTVAIAAVNPDVIDIVDWDKTLRRVQELDGAPRETIVSLEKLGQIRKQKQEMKEALMKIEADKAKSETARNVGQAASSAGLTNKAA